MRIVSGTLELAAQHTLTRSTAVTERLEAWVGADPALAPAARVSLSAEARAAASPASLPPPSGAPASGAPAPDAGGQPAPGGRAELDRLILERTFGVRVPRPEAPRAAAADAPGTAAAAPAPPPGAPGRAGWGLRQDRVEVATEAETLAVEARGQLTTADGRRLEVALAASQSREAEVRTELHLRAGDARQVDPLALDLAGGGARLEATPVAFDLDADGTPEQVARLAAGSAWLALDRNGNGRVDDGGELLGPRTGDGFGELRALDADGNGFVDEGDPGFGALRLWEPGAGGALRTLAEAGVGALAVASVATPFQLQGGAVRETGVYLREDGGAGLVQHVDLAV